MKKIKKIITLILALCCFVGAYAQTKNTIRGKIIDQKDKSAVIGATIVESDKTNRVINGTITDIDGNFVYQMKDPGNTMNVSVIGYQTKPIKPNFEKAVVIELVSSDIELDQVTITAKAKSDNQLTNIEERDNASSRVKVDLMEMKDAGITSAADALQGKVSGLDIISASGDPGSGSQIVIRGLSSIGNNKPLIVIDGIPQSNVPSSFDLSSSDSQDISRMVNVALQDIKSIEVLKDAASTAVYGSQGADGVLLIETNRGKMGKVQFDYQYKNSMNFQPPAVPMLNGNEYTTLQLEEMHNAYGVFSTPDEIAYNRDYALFYNYSANTDWLSLITQNSATNDHYFKISGGGEKTRYFTSFSYVNEGGTTINTGAKTFSSRVNLDYFLSKKTLFTVQFNYNNQTRQGNYEMGLTNGWQNRNVREMAYMKAPNMSVMEYDSDGVPTGEYFTPVNSYQGNGQDYFNPVAVAKLGKNNSNNTSIENSFKLKYTIADWLVFRESVSFTYRGRKDNKFLPYDAIGVDWLNYLVNRSAEVNDQSSSFRTESLLSYTIPFTKTDHEMSGTLSWITNQNNSEFISVESSKSPSTDIQDPANGGQIVDQPNAAWYQKSLRSGNTESRDLGALFTWNYKYKDRYMLQTVVRADANSAFGINNRWGVFKGISGAWRFSSEPFLSNSSGWLSESKLRASWGTSGRPPGDTYARFATYESSGRYITNSAIIPTKVQLDNLKWESITSINLGFDLNLFKDRLFVSGEIYSKNTTDIMFPSNNWQGYNIPTSSGFSTLKYFNGGEMENKGWEFMTNWKIVRTKDWLVSVDFNASQNINSFLELPDNFNTENAVSINNGEYPQRIVSGQSIGSFFGFRYKGVYASDADAVARDVEGNIMYDGENIAVPMTYKGTYLFKGGDAIYEDVNHDGKIDLNDVVYIGDSNPTLTGSFGNSLRYKNWNFSFSIYYRVGYDIINMTALNAEGMNGRDNQSKAVLHRWRVQGQNEPGMLPRAYMNNPANNLGSDRYVEQGDFMRLNNVKLGYDLGNELCRKLSVQSASFSISARKLFTITNYSGQDPEVGQNAADPFDIGKDNAKTPPPRVVTISLSVGF
ncbi:MAG: SusC/RagA family TonB-linked outer membrane protein [Prolixibacteraceae bacterium]|nr:SusC/RagA family TonB-linked outer membrane protein [Prolixibacteraceae bacterium]